MSLPFVFQVDTEPMRDFSKLVYRHQDRVYAFALHYLGNGEDAADITQDVLIRFWENADRLEDSRIVPWLMQVTRNLCVDRFRRRRLQRRTMDIDSELLSEMEGASDDPDPEVVAENADLRDLIVRGLQTLPEPHRSIVMLREIQDLKYEDIGEALGLPLTTVKVYLHRGRRMLRACLSKSVIHDYQTL